MESLIPSYSTVVQNPDATRLQIAISLIHETFARHGLSLRHFGVIISNDRLDDSRFRVNIYNRDQIETGTELFIECMNDVASLQIPLWMTIDPMTNESFKDQISKFGKMPWDLYVIHENPYAVHMGYDYDEIDSKYYTEFFIKRIVWIKEIN
jgi:hypothetical protein